MHALESACEVRALSHIQGTSDTPVQPRLTRMGRRKKSAPKVEAWCWYCDREFEDEKVLLLHQRARHYKCQFCPRKLNTAGGLTVHLRQVHKAEPSIIANALPGRESFEIEIYGMVGIPQADLEEWLSRKAKRGEGGVDGFRNGRPLRPKIDKGIISKDDLRIQLEAHKALMSGKAPPPGAAMALFGLVPPPTFNFPPPGFARPPPDFSKPPPSLIGPSPGSAPQQSYPAVQAPALPPSADPKNNTAEALAAANNPGNTEQAVNREADMEHMQRQAKRRRSDEETTPDAKAEPPMDSSPNRHGRARAADLF